MGKTPLTRKLLLAFAIILVLVCFQAILTIVLLDRFVQQTAQIIDPALERVDDLAHVEADLLRMRALEYSTIWTTDVTVVQQQSTSIDNLQADVGARLNEYRTLHPDPELIPNVIGITRDYQGYLAATRQVSADVARGDRQAALHAYVDFQPSFLHLDDELHAVRHQEYRLTESLRDRLMQFALWARWPIALVVLLVAFAEAGVGLYLSQDLASGLDALLGGARRIQREKFDEPVPRPPETEFATLADTLNGVMTSFAAQKIEREQFHEERLRLARDRLSQIVQAQEDERARISRELHDQAGQALIALRYDLSRVQRQTDNPAVAEEIDRLMNLAGQTAQQIRSLAGDLRPSVLDDLGLVPALRSCARDFSERVGLSIEFSTNDSVPRLIPDVETTIFRVVQEALTNVAKHARAQHAWIDVDVLRDQLRIDVRDDGQGFNSRETVAENPLGDNARPGLGLIGIRERVQLLRGRMDIVSSPGEGTRLRVTIPLRGNTRVVSMPVNGEMQIG